MGFWNHGRKGKHDRESASGRHRGSVKEEPTSPPPRRSPAPAPFTIGPTAGGGARGRQYITADVCRRYWETRTPLPCSNMHLPNNWHLSADRMTNPPVPQSGRARREEIERRRRLLPDNLYYDDRYAPDFRLWDTWLQDEHDVRHASFFADTSTGPRWPRPKRAARASQERGRTRVRGLTPTPSPSPSSSPPPPPRMTAEEEARLMARVMEDSIHTHDELQWEGLEEMVALSAAGDVAIPELDVVATEEAMEDAPVAAFHPDLGEVVQAPPAFQPAPVYHAPPSHLWTTPA
ncbi:hypothetical protein VPH35_113397 [Triticum aestivum]